MSSLDLIFKPGADVVALGAPVLTAAAMALTGWLSYRRIVGRYPAGKPATPQPANEDGLVDSSVGMDDAHVRQPLARASPGLAVREQDVAESMDRIGDVLWAQGDLPAALRSFSDGLAIRERLAQVEPGDAGLQHDLSVSMRKIGDVLVAQGDLSAALPYLRRGLEINEGLAEAAAGQTARHRDLTAT